MVQPPPSYDQGLINYNQALVMPGQQTYQNRQPNGVVAVGQPVILLIHSADPQS